MEKWKEESPKGKIEARKRKEQEKSVRSYYIDQDVEFLFASIFLPLLDQFRCIMFPSFFLPCFLAKIALERLLTPGRFQGICNRRKGAATLIFTGIPQEERQCAVTTHTVSRDADARRV